MQKPPMSLKQFMLRTEILKLYRGFLRLGRLFNEPPGQEDSAQKDVSINSTNNLNKYKKSNAVRDEWIDWVRSEFRIRQTSATDEEMTRALLVQGKRQLQEMERTIMLAMNRNTNLSKNTSITNCQKSKDTIS